MLIHSKRERVPPRPGPFPSAAGGTEPPRRSRLPPLCPPALQKAHWLFCLPAVGVVPPLTKSPADEELTPSRAVRRSANGLTNGLSSRVSAAWGTEARTGLSCAVGPGACVCPPICPPFEKPRAGGGRQDKREEGNSPTGEVCHQGDIPRDKGQGRHT